MLLDHLTDAAHYYTPTMATTNGFVPSMPSPTEMMDTTAPNQYFASNHYNDQHASANDTLPSFAANPFAPTVPATAKVEGSPLEVETVPAPRLAPFFPFAGSGKAA